MHLLSQKLLVTSKIKVLFTPSGSDSEEDQRINGKHQRKNFILRVRFRSV